MSSSLKPTTVIRLVAGRELNTRLRTRGFLIGTVVILAVLVGYLLLQMMLFGQTSRTTVGLTGQASAIAEPLRSAGEEVGENIETRQIADPADGRAQVEEGDLDVLVSGSAGNLQAIVQSDLDEQVRALLDGIAQQEVLNAKLFEAGLNPAEVLGDVHTAGVEVTTIEKPDPEEGQRFVIAVVMMFLLYMGIAAYGGTVAQGVVEEKSSRVVEILLSAVRPWQLLLGKVIGIGLVGLIQLVVLGVAGLAIATATGLLTITGVATGTLLWGLLWYVLGYFLYATLFAGAGSLVSRQEEMQTVVTPITIMLVGGFVAAITMLSQADSTGSAVLSLIPPISPILMPSRIATGAASGWEIALALVLILATIMLLTWLGGRIYRAAILHTGSRVSLKTALRG